MRAIRFHPVADQELAEAREWYEARSEVAAQAFALEIDHAIERILEGR
jgi:plasmid stabilization system protein ParE